MGLRHLRVITALDHRFEVAGAFEVRPEALVPACVPRLHSEDEAIARAEVVIVATPTGVHAGTVVRALAAGRHVLVEKPLGTTAVEAAAMANLSVRSGAGLFVGHSERFNPVIRVLARLTRTEPVLAIDLLRVGPSRPADCGILVNLGVHDFDLAAYLGGAPLTLRDALSGPGENVAHVLLTTGGGAVVHLCVDRSTPTRRRSIVLATPRWQYEGDLLAHRLVRTARTTRPKRMGLAGGQRMDVPLPLVEPLAAQALALADALDGTGVREIATGDDGACAVAIAERAAFQSARSQPPPRTAAGA